MSDQPNAEARAGVDARGVALMPFGYSDPPMPIDDERVHAASIVLAYMATRRRLSLSAAQLVAPEVIPFMEQAVSELARRARSPRHESLTEIYLYATATATRRQVFKPFIDAFEETDAATY